MYRANIFQKNITTNRHSETIDFVLSLNHSLVNIKDKRIKIKDLKKNTYKYSIEFFEKDPNTITYIGKFDNGDSFRLIQPYGFSLEMIKSKHNSKGAFSIASLNSDDYAIHFILTDKDDKRDLIVTEKDNFDQLQRLIEGAFMSNQFGLESKFIEITIRLLEMIRNNPSELRNLKGGNRLVQIMNEKINYYNPKEQNIIREI